MVFHWENRHQGKQLALLRKTSSPTPPAASMALVLGRNIRGYYPPNPGDWRCQNLVDLFWRDLEKVCKLCSYVDWRRGWQKAIENDVEQCIIIRVILTGVSYWLIHF